MSSSRNPYFFFNNFVLRSPLLDFKFYQKLTSIDSIADDTLIKIYQNDAIKEALFLASPSLYFQMEKWINGDLEGKKQKKLKFSMLKYLTRMSSRCTPFGLFAGCALGSFSDSTEIKLQELSKNKRHTRLDMNYLVALSQDLAKKETIKNQLLFYPNSSIYRSGDQFRYIEYFYVNGKRQHQIIQVTYSVYLERILNHARNGAYIKDLAVLLVDDDITEEEALHFIEELLDSQLLVSELEPSVSGPEFMEHIQKVIQKLQNSSTESHFLQQIALQLAKLDTTIGNDPVKYIDLSETLKAQPSAFELKYLFQTDMELVPKTNTISREVLQSLKKGMLLLNKISAKPEESNLMKFKNAFSARYEEREMKLSTVLDVETGIGYLQDSGSGDINPLVDDIVLPYPKSNSLQSTKIGWNKVHQILHKKLVTCDREGTQRIVLTDDDFKDLNPNWDDLPDTMSAMISIVKEDQAHKIVFSGIGGSSAANLLGRFCHGDQHLNTYTKSIADLERQMNPDKILAEIVHLPEARVGNILMRPKFRAYEIPYLGRSVLPSKNQIPIDDLYISVRGDRIVLRSKSLNKEVVPHLTNAHNFSYNAVPVYHFLCDMQAQNLRSGLYFNFGFFSETRDFLPRVEYGDLILHEAKWKIKKEDISSLIAHQENLETFKESLSLFCDKHRLPQHCLLVDGDNELLINFKNATSVQMLIDLVKNRTSFSLSEFLFANDGLVKTEEGHTTHQLVVSVYNENKLISSKLSS